MEDSSCSELFKNKKDVSVSVQTNTKITKRFLENNIMDIF